MTQTSSGVGTAEVARSEARSVGEKTKAEVAEVGDEAKYQARRLADEAWQQARQRADDQLGRTASTLGKVSEELRSMADASAERDGYLAAMARDGATVLDDMAGRFQDGGLDRALDDVRRFARRRPVAFLAGAFAVGIGLGRLTRNTDVGQIAAAARDDDGHGDPAISVGQRAAAVPDFELSSPQGAPLTPGGSVAEIRSESGYGSGQGGVRP